MQNDTGSLELTPREQYRLKKLLNGSGAAASGEGRASESEVVFDPEELALVVKEAVRETFEEFFEVSRDESKNGGGSKSSKSGSAEQPKKVRIRI